MGYHPILYRIARHQSRDFVEKAKKKKPTVNYKKLTNKNQTIKITKALSIKKAQGVKTYKKTKGNKKITVDKKSGKIQVKTGLGKGTYPIKIKVTAAGNANYKKCSKTVTVKITVK